MRWLPSFTLSTLLLAGNFPGPALAQLPPLKSIAAPAQPAGAIELPVSVAAMPAAPESWLALGSEAVVHNVSMPTLTPVLPPADRRTGAAVIVAPGGGYLMLSMDSEGWATARWLADHGIAAFVLKYRLKPSPVEPTAFGATLGRLLSDAASGPLAADAPSAYPPAVADAQSAMRLVRARAAQWGVDPARIGFMGFSAGAITSLALVAADQPGTMPSFIAPIYPSMAPETVPADAPPMFVGIAADDPLFGGRGFGLIDSWRRSGHGAELHLYERGGHGFGGAGRAGTTTTHWLDEFYWWLQSHGVLEARP